MVIAGRDGKCRRPGCAGAVYAGTEPLTAEDIAEAIVWVAGRPPHVDIDELVIKPTDQAAIHKVRRRTTT